MIAFQRSQPYVAQEEEWALSNIDVLIDVFFNVAQSAGFQNRPASNPRSSKIYMLRPKKCSCKI